MLPESCLMLPSPIIPTLPFPVTRGRPSLAMLRLPRGSQVHRLLLPLLLPLPTLCLPPKVTCQSFEEEALSMKRWPLLLLGHSPRYPVRLASLKRPANEPECIVKGQQAWKISPPSLFFLNQTLVPVVNPCQVWTISPRLNLQDVLARGQEICTTSGIMRLMNTR